MLDNVDAALESAISSHEAGDLLVAGEKYLVRTIQTNVFAYVGVRRRHNHNL